MKKIAFLGSKNIGYDCLTELIDKSSELNFKIVGVLTNPKRDGGITELCQSEGIPLLNSLDNYLKLDEVDIAISIQYHQILKKNHIEKANEITLNLHMAPLPEYRGCNQFTFAILNNDSEFGTTLHRLEEGIDSGDILFEKRFLIPKGAWVQDLYDITYNKSVELFKESIKDIINGNYTLKPQDSFKLRKTSFHLRKEVHDIKEIDLYNTGDVIAKSIKSSYMPGFEPPFTYIDNEKVYFIREKDYKKSSQ